MLRLGDKFTLTENAIENYGTQYAGREFPVSHVATNTNQHPGYDEVVNAEGYEPMALYDAKELNFSVYEYEIEAA